MRSGDGLHVPVTHSAVVEQSWNAIAPVQLAAHDTVDEKPIGPPNARVAQHTWPGQLDESVHDGPASPPVAASSPAPELELEPELEVEVDPELFPVAASSVFPLFPLLLCDPPHATAQDAPQAITKRMLVSFMENCPPVVIRSPVRRHRKPRRGSRFVPPSSRGRI